MKKYVNNYPGFDICPNCGGARFGRYQTVCEEGDNVDIEVKCLDCGCVFFQHLTLRCKTIDN